MQFKEFSKFLEQIEKTASRNEITVIISEFIGKLSAEEIKKCMYLVQGRLVPKYVDLEFNMSRKSVLNALGQAVNDSNIVKKSFSETGDAGLTASFVKENYDLNFDNPLGALGSQVDDSQNKELSISEIYEHLEKIAKLEGKGSQAQKMFEYIELINNLDSLSTRYVTRVIVGDLRLGVSDKTILDSLSWFKTGDKSLRKDLDKAFGAKSDIGELAQLVVSSNQLEKDLETIKLVPGVPVASKLVERESSPEKVWERMPNCFVQPKLDGLRGQIHYRKSGLENEKDKVGAVFSRNMENMTEQFPDLIYAISNLGIDSIILDSEIIGYDKENDEYLSYQETMQRKRKYDVEAYADKIPVKSMCFDILYLNGEDLTQKPIEERIALLEKILKKSDMKVLDMLETIHTKSFEELDSYFQDKVLNGLEGIITKEEESNYEPGTRNYKWIKLKANTQSDLVDTLDVVVMGYYIGRGQRAKFGIGALLTGVYDPKEEKYYSIGKVGSGIKDDDFEKIVKDLNEIKVDEKPKEYEVEKPLEPDYWVEPKIIAEIDADEITRSPNHTAARGVESKVKKDDSSRGLSVRFPRLKIWNRDKDYPNTVEELVKIYELRKGK